jgi:hypothetical protein
VIFRRLARTGGLGELALPSGRYAATIGVTPTGPDDPIAVAERRGLAPFEAVLRGYDIAPQEMTHALRALRSIFHGFATLQASGGFQWSTDRDESFEWLIKLVDRGLRSTPVASPPFVPGPTDHR